tara:strand:- start:228 stop:2018 length:1791 start_codon:yes stop_codon:yes gene_type:complete
MSVLNKLTEGIVNRDLKKEGDALLSKWEKTGLLEGLTSDVDRNGMARLLENQAKQLLKEASSMAAGDVEGFSSVAFPLVRRVFGGLLANDLVSVQPMSLPSGLIFFLDFTYESGKFGIDAGESVYGGGVVGKGIQTGVTDITEEGGGLYNLQSAYSLPSGTVTVTTTLRTSGSVSEGGVFTGLTPSAADAGASADYNIARLLKFDPDLTTGAKVAIVTAPVSELTAGGIEFNDDDLIDIVPFDNGTQPLIDGKVVRRLTQFDPTETGVPTRVLFVVAASGSEDVAQMRAAADGIDKAAIPLRDNFDNSSTIGAVVGADTWGLEEPLFGTGNNSGAANKNEIPEIDIKVDSIAVTAQTRKLKAKWSPELGQDLNAYHNLDAEVELTSILSEQIALEIDREIISDLIHGATAGTFYWSRSPGLFVNRTTGAEIGASAAAPDFTGTVSEWYETLIETINDVSAQIHRKTLRGGANFIVTSPEVANILEFTAGFRASVTADADRGTAGAVKVGAISKKFDVYIDPYFPRNLILVGRKGGSFLESGYVYAPYVPLQVTPTIFGTEDFIPRKGVMTRYAKKMVRPDMYGLVICRGLLGESGA